MNRLISVLTRYRFAAGNEAQLQLLVERTLRAEEFVFEREVALSARDRIDFLIEGGAGLELKTQGSETAVHRQLLRYAESERITELVLLTTRAAHTQLPRTVLGKRLTVRFQGGIA